MKKIFISLALLSMVSGAAMSQKKILLNENFSSVSVVYDDHFAPMPDTWTVESPKNLEMPEKWCVYADGKAEDVNNVAYIDRSYSADTPLPFEGVLISPELNLDGTYQLSYQWQTSPAGYNSSHPYDFQIRVIEAGKTSANADVIWDFTNKDDLLESGVQPTDYSPYLGWAWNTSKLDLTPYKGKKVKIAFFYKARTSQANVIKLDNIKVEEYDAAQTPIAQFDRTAWNFGDVYIGAKMSSDIITLTNVGTNGLNISSVECPDGFSVVADRDLATAGLKKNETARIQIFCEPSLTSAASGRITFKSNGPDVSIAVTATKKMVPDGGLFEGFESEVFPPAGWQTKKWRASQAGIEGVQAATPNAYYQEENYLISPRIDASKSPATIEFSYADFYYGEEIGADTEVRLLFSKDGGTTWSLIDTFDYEDTYNEIIRKTYTQNAASDNCYWKFEWELTYYDSESGAEASLFYLDAVVLNNVYGAGGLPTEASPISPANNAKDVFNRGIVLQWEPAQFAEGYKLYVGTDAACTSLVNGLDVAGALSYALPTLDYNKRYYWKVEGYNSHGTVENAPIWNFTTITDPTITTLPYREGFDNEFAPKGWNLYGDGNSMWKANEISPYDGKASAMANPRGTGETCTMETPDVVLPADAAFATFYWGDGVAITLQKPESGYAANTTKGNDGISEIAFEVYADGKWTRKALLSDKTNPYWIRERIDLSEYAGKRVAFRWVYTCNNYYQANGACVDNFSVELQAREKLSFNVEGWDAGKLNHDSQTATKDVYSILNDGNSDAVIKSVTFSNPNFITSLKAGDKIPSGGALTFRIHINAENAGRIIDDAMEITTVNGTVARFPVRVEVLPADIRFFGFEDGENGDLFVKDLTMIDVDNKNTISLAFVDYAHIGDKMAFMVINYKMNDWPNPYPRTGNQCLVTFGAYDYGTTEDWVISPYMAATAESSFDFYGRNYEGKDNVGGGEVFGPGMVDIMVSKSADPTDRNAYELVASYQLPYPVNDEYGEFKTDLSKYAGHNIHVALVHKTSDGLAYLLDDFQYNHFSTFYISGAESIEADSEISLRENPVGDTLHLNGVTDAQLTVYRTDGAKVAAGYGDSLNVSHLAAGYYLLNVTDSQTTRSIRFIKK